jgi:hypothetical protein
VMTASAGHKPCTVIQPIQISFKLILKAPVKREMQFAVHKMPVLVFVNNRLKNQTVCELHKCKSKILISNIPFVLSNTQQ